MLAISVGSSPKLRADQQRLDSSDQAGRREAVVERLHGGPEASILLPLMEWWPNAMSGPLQRATEMGARSSSLYGQYVKPTKIFIDDEQKEFLFQEDIAPLLRSLGYAYSTSQINKLCAPAVN